ncbi:MAG: hypothetical protein Q6370_018835 [Candidatus Sigynarchaeota archaeon]
MNPTCFINFVNESRAAALPSCTHPLSHRLAPESSRRSTFRSRYPPWKSEFSFPFWKSLSFCSGLVVPRLYKSSMAALEPSTLQSGFVALARSSAKNRESPSCLATRSSSAPEAATGSCVAMAAALARLLLEGSFLRGSPD